MSVILGSSSMLEDCVSHHPLFRMIQRDHPDLLDTAEVDQLTLCLPDVRTIRDVELGHRFFSHHLLHQDEEQQLVSGDGSVVAEVRDRERKLRVLQAPGYHPSYTRGLHTAHILARVQSRGVQVLLLDLPLVPSYSHNMGNTQVAASLASRRRRNLYKQESRDTLPDPKSTKTRPWSAFHPRPPSQATIKTRVCSADSSLRHRLTKQKCVDTPRPRLSPPRQVSADSGIEADLASCSSREGAGVYELPARITSYEESEAFIMDQAHSDTFLAHLQRLVAPLTERLDKLSSTEGDIKEENVLSVVPSLRRAVQEATISFPRPGARSPRYQDMLSTAIENCVLQLLHPKLWPLVQQIHSKTDRQLHKQMTTSWTRISCHMEQLGLGGDWAVPFPAALVELASLDMRSTPLDKLTALHDTIEQVRAQIREMEAETAGVDTDLGKIEAAVLGALLVQARPLYLHSSLFYLSHFTLSPRQDMRESLDTLHSAFSQIQGVLAEPWQSRASSAAAVKMKREYSLEDLIDLTDEIEQRYDRHGDKRHTDIHLTPVDIFREKLARRLELSSNEMTRHQEEAWARADSEPEHGKQDTQEAWRQSQATLATVLHQIQSKLICSSRT